MKKIFIFFVSFVSVLSLLLVERLSGFGWDYHLDAVTYVNSSVNFVNWMKSQEFYRIFGAFWYFIVYFLDSNIYVITFINIMLFSITNVLIYSMHSKFFVFSKLGLLLLSLLLFNPYRMHLSTTLLKETAIIFLIVFFLYFGRRIIPFLVILFSATLIRLAAILYFISALPVRYFRLSFFIGLLSLPFIFDLLIMRLDESNTVNLHSRDFDTIPTFQEYGYFGSLLRAIVWPFISLTGLFVLKSPALPMFMVAIGSIFNIIYASKLQFFSWYALFLVFCTLGIFAIIAPGFTSYIRYVYPLLSIWPLFIILHASR